MSKIIAQGTRDQKAIVRRVNGELKFAHRASEKVNRRINILEGRLS